MTTPGLLRRPLAFLPPAMSSLAMLTIVVHVARNGIEPQPDEGAAAHLWQLLLLTQLPVVAFFAIQWLPAAPKQARAVLALQVACIAAAAAPVAVLGW